MNQTATNPATYKVLVVDDDGETCELLTTVVATVGHTAEAVLTGEQALERAREVEFDVVVTDGRMPGMDGFTLCERLSELRPGLSVVLVTGVANMSSAIDALRARAYDFLVKPVDPGLLLASVARAGHHSRMQRELIRLRQHAEGRPVEELVGESGAMRDVHELIQRIAPTDAAVLIQGETGTGKEVVARAIHAKSSRASGPFVALNCAAVPHGLFESELFGHAKGAFTDAKFRREGLFREANGGTIFLDEVGELPPDIQPKLLRALQERRVRPVGANEEMPFDARIITATNRDLEKEVAERRFREDLFYRINVVRLELPPLRDRGTDILTIAQHLLRRIAPTRDLSLSEPVADRLMSYDWPGNVRELENCMERAVALARFNQITVEDLPEKLHKIGSERVVVRAEDPSELVTLDELERRYIHHVLRLLKGNKSRTAQALGLDRRTLYRKLERENASAEAAEGGDEPPDSGGNAQSGGAAPKTE